MERWVRGLLVAFVSGAIVGGANMLLDPEHFNLFNGGWKPMLSASIGAGLLGSRLYLMESPKPRNKKK